MTRRCKLHGRPHGRGLLLLVALVAVLLVGAAPIAQAAEQVQSAQFAEGEHYVLPAGETVADDLYVSAGDVTIDGTVDGDLVAFGGYIAINGEVTGDLIASAGGVTIDGKVGDDARVAAGGVTVNGSVGDDLIAAGGGAAPGGFVYPINIAGRNVPAGLFVNSTATVGGDAYLVGGTGVVAGTVAGDLFTGMNDLRFSGKVGGDANLHGSTIAVADNAQVRGTLAYETGAGNAGAAGVNAVPPGIAPVVAPILRTPEAPPPEEPLLNRLIWWMISLARVLLGLLAVGALLLALTPGFAGTVSGELRRDPWFALGFGLLFVLVMFPLGMLLVGLAWLFWGAAPGGLAVSFFLLGLGGILWIVSPALTGRWLGQLILPAEQPLLQLFTGGVLILLAARAAQWLPIGGWFVSWLILLASFTLAAGAILAAYRHGRTGDLAQGISAPPAPPVGMQPTAV